MAKKKKDNIDENDDINEGKSGDIHEADDNFGLPDVEYTPVNRDKTEEDVPGKKDPEHQVPAEPEYSTDPVSEPASETTTTEETAYASSSAESTPPPPSEESTNYRYRRYNERKEEGSNAPKIIILLALVLLVAAAIWYFGIYAPQQEELRAQMEQEQAQQEQVERDRAAQEEQERLEREEAQREAERLAAEQEAAAAEPETGSLETISNRTGRYYVVVASALDGDLAMDYGRRLSGAGSNIKLLEPTGNNKFYRVAVGDFDSWAAAQEEANELKSNYGDEVWVVKF